MTSADDALLVLLDHLRRADYRFVTPTPATHARVVARPDRATARDTADVLGWSLPFGPDVLPAAIEDALRRAGVVVSHPLGEATTVRVSSLCGDLYLHSAYPTDDQDAVFFGPDSYRFGLLVDAELAARPLAAEARVVDVGTGAGVGAILAAKSRADARVLMTDVNRAALRLARLNAAAAGVAVEPIEAAGLDGLDGRFDLVTMNPPYMIDAAGRAYRDGGGMHGAQLSLDLAVAAAARLAPGGRVVLYTGSAIVGGVDPLRRALTDHCRQAGHALRYHEIDPDVFGEELETEAYRDVDRIALVAAAITAPA